jgi:hypothetical protein
MLELLLLLLLLELELLLLELELELQLLAAPRSVAMVSPKLHGVTERPCL